MNYEKIYENLINSRKNLNRKRFKRSNSSFVYYENHHIVPKCFGGTNEKENLVLLTAREHFVAHLLLVYCNKGDKKRKMSYALWRLCGCNDRSKRKYNSHQYDLAKKIMIEANIGKKMSEYTKAKLKEGNKNKIITEELKKRMSESAKQSFKSGNRKSPPPHNDITKEKISIAHKGKIHSEETCKKMSEQRKGKKKSEQGRKNIAKGKLGNNWNIGSKRTEEQKARMSAAMKGKNIHMKGVKKSVTKCPYCQKEGAVNVMGRWHFDNCKNK